MFKTKKLNEMFAVGRGGGVLFYNCYMNDFSVERGAVELLFQGCVDIPTNRNKCRDFTFNYPLEFEHHLTE